MGEWMLASSESTIALIRWMGVLVCICICLMGAGASPCKHFIQMHSHHMQYRFGLATIHKVIKIGSTSYVSLLTDSSKTLN